jgi:hypothetical protein
MTPNADSERVIDTWLDAGHWVSNVSAGIAHHHATGHDGGGSGLDYYCHECPFEIADGRVVAGGMIRTLSPTGSYETPT